MNVFLFSQPFSTMVPGCSQFRQGTWDTRLCSGGSPGLALFSPTCPISASSSPSPQPGSAAQQESCPSSATSPAGWGRQRCLSLCPPVWPGSALTALSQVPHALALASLSSDPRPQNRNPQSGLAPTCDILDCTMALGAQVNHPS